MFDNILNNGLLNKVSTHALDLRPSFLKSLFVIILLMLSLLFFAMEVVMKKVNPRKWFSDDTVSEPQIKTAS